MPVVSKNDGGWCVGAEVSELKCCGWAERLICW